GSPIDFRKLKEQLPAELAGIKRSSHDGQKIAAAGFAMSQAEATYSKASENDDENLPRVHVVYTDFGPGESNTAAISASLWAQAEMDQESDDGYSKTVKVGSNIGMETYSKESKQGTLELAVAKRFMVRIETSVLPPEQLQKIAAELPLAKLAELAK
ncbi:MAG TPA: hypothetical protein VGB55_03050, partial [Tepidisphaeraceae bacterium]